MEGYKTSRYNTVHKTNHGLILFNTLSCGVLKVKDEDANKLHHTNSEIVPFLASKNQDYQKVLITHGFFVKNDIDEFALVKSRLNRSKYGTANVALTINTGLACNCRCTYCFEGQEHYEDSVLTSEKADDIVAFIKKEFPPSTKLNLSFVGGEPLLCFDHVKYILCELKNTFSDVQFHLITNGILINTDIAKFLKEAQATIVQVTIDGLKHHHNKKRRDVNGGGTYDMIVENTRILQNAGVRVVIRANIDQEFMDKVNIPEWIDTIKTNFDLTKSIWFYVAQVATSGKGAKIADEKYIQNMVSIYKAFMENQIPVDFGYMFRSAGKCAIASENNLNISCDGKIYKCWNDLSSDNFNGRLFGNIYDGVDRAKMISYTNSLDVLEDAECRDCLYLPVCSGCPEYILAGMAKCTPLKYYPEKLIPLFLHYKGTLPKTT